MLAALRPGSLRVLSTQTSITDGFINRARQVIQWCDAEVVEQVIDGTLPLNDAYATAQQIQATEQAEEIARKKAEKEAAEQARRDAARQLAAVAAVQAVGTTVPTITHEGTRVSD